MGNIVNALAEDPVKEVRLSVAQRQVLEGLGFREKELETLKRYFQELDEERVGRVDLEVLTEKIGIEAKFIARIVDINDGVTDGRLPFVEFALSIWNFCTLDDSELVAALFCCYDVDNNGTLSVAELSEMSRDLTPKGRTLGPALQLALAKFDDIVASQEKMRYEHNMAKAKQRLQGGGVGDSGGGGAAGGDAGLDASGSSDDGIPSDIRISLAFLEAFVKKNQALGHPLTKFHLLVRQEILGSTTWAELRHR
jgi:Ca2+-binding EF-hand superfamily protein